MLRKVLLRASVLMLALSSIVACVTALALWYYSRLVGPCPTGTVPNSDPVNCYYRVEWMPDRPAAAVVFFAGASFCLLASWVSFQFKKTG
ncbi:hypothetical protein [Xanthomonas vasicola]|uniref:Transmembrane protein n=1 Tax=Xanthomonas vasicola TaxID=56459 RepID=A0ABD7S2E7_XANVA|nr:hypothetical protein [Xanthomonas vasicola]KGR43486.1 hypothetical protein NX04_08850 [Xanthomonas vasicola]KGR59839.1 hypothetical protein NX79_13245 [Xanthomonas vasicola]MDO6983390.1 hypothetical protein [Xanthomonas vasicola]PPV01433.1 hypothetical protein XvhCFBP2543_16890 [Xanthomonas vasicola]TWQ30050.1 hypothetical protein FQJ97_23015 [Xanthomonas vasicola]